MPTDFKLGAEAMREIICGTICFACGRPGEHAYSAVTYHDGVWQHQHGETGRWLRCESAWIRALPLPSPAEPLLRMSSLEWERIQAGPDFKASGLKVSMDNGRVTVTFT